MAQPIGRPPPALERLVHEAEDLRERLHRIAIALSLTEDMMAEALERSASAGVADAPDYRQRAILARASADICRTCAQRLDELHDHL